MIVDCDSCPGQYLAPPACPSCVVHLLLGHPPAQHGGAAPPAARVPAPVPEPRAAHRPLPVELVRTTDDTGAPLDAREQRAVAVLTARGLLAGPTARRGDATAPDGRRSARPGGGRRARPRTA